jgi:hypothetical protein
MRTRGPSHSPSPPSPPDHFSSSPYCLPKQLRSRVCVRALHFPCLVCTLVSLLVDTQVAQPELVTEQLVLEAISAAVGLDAAARAAAEAALTKWEKNSSAGFISSLMKIVSQPEQAPLPARLLAAIVAKNAVGSSWRKTMGSKEWSHVPPDEKAFVRSMVESVLLSEPSDQVALQLGLLIANMAQFDFPAEWPHLLTALASGAEWGNAAVPGAAKLRAMRTAKQVVLALGAKRPSINTAEQRDAGSNLQALVDSRLADFKQMRASATQIFAAVRRQSAEHVEAVVASGVAAAAVPPASELAHRCLI